jgi:hypothetical protein
MEDEKIHILYQKHILDSSSGVLAYDFLHAFPKKGKSQLNVSIGSFGANLEHYYIQVQAMGVSFDDKIKSHFFLSALQQKGIEVDRFVDRLDNVPDAGPLPEELTLIELVLHIKDIHSFQNSSTAVANRCVCPNNYQDSSNPHQN